MPYETFFFFYFSLERRKPWHVALLCAVQDAVLSWFWYLVASLYCGFPFLSYKLYITLYIIWKVYVCLKCSVSIKSLRLAHILLPKLKYMKIMLMNVYN